MRRRLLLVVPAVAVLAGFNLQRGHEADQLAACRTEADGEVQHLVARALAVEQYAGSALTSPTTPPAVRAGAAKLVTDSVASDLPAVLAARERCGFRTLPGSGTADARDAYLVDLDARIAALRRATTERDALHDPVLFSP